MHCEVSDQLSAILWAMNTDCMCCDKACCYCRWPQQQQQQQAAAAERMGQTITALLAARLRLSWTPSPKGSQWPSEGSV